MRDAYFTPLFSESRIETVGGLSSSHDGKTLSLCLHERSRSPEIETVRHSARRQKFSLAATLWAFQWDTPVHNFLLGRFTMALRTANHLFRHRKPPIKLFQNYHYLRYSTNHPASTKPKEQSF